MVMLSRRKKSSLNLINLLRSPFLAEQRVREREQNKTRVGVGAGLQVYRRQEPEQDRTAQRKEGEVESASNQPYNQFRPTTRAPGVRGPREQGTVD